MRKLGAMAVLATAVALVGADKALAKKGGGCGGGCSSSCCSPCYSGCGYGGCGYGYGGCGYGYGGCGYSGYSFSSGCGSSSCGHASYGGSTYGSYAVVDTTSATMVVSLPEDAKLTIDGEKTVSTSGQRTFVTRDLTPGKAYVYHLKAEVVRDGHVVSATKEVTIRTGQETSVQLEIPAATVASR